jgi:hypothetical protein
MSQTSATQQRSEDTIRPFRVAGVPEAELADLRKFFLRRSPSECLRVSRRAVPYACQTKLERQHQSQLKGAVR